MATTLQPLVVQLSGSLAPGTRLIDQFLHQEPTPQQMAIFAKQLRALLREVGRRIMAWVLHHLEPACADEAPARQWLQGQAERRRRKHRTAMATLCGTVVVWRRLYEPLGPGARSLHPLELNVGREAGLATPALAQRIGPWAVDHSQRQVLEMLPQDHGVRWSCTTLRKLLGSLSAGMGAHRHAAHVEHVVGWLPQARVATGRWQPTLVVGRDGVTVPLRHGVWTEGAPAPCAGLDRRGKRLGTVSLGQMPQAGQTTLTAPWPALIQDILCHVDSQGFRFVSISDDGYHC